METLPVAAKGLADPAGGLVASDDGAEYVLARGPCAFADCQTRRGESRAGVSHVTQVAVVRGGGVAEHRVDSRDLIHRQLRTIEPDRGFRLAAALLHQLANNTGRVDE